MMSSRGKKPGGSPQKQPTGKESVHIVFAATVETKTGRLRSRNIIGVFDDIMEAKNLERKFNARKQEAEGVVSRSFCVRYGMPYVAPMVKELMVD